MKNKYYYIIIIALLLILIPIIIYSNQKNIFNSENANNLFNTMYYKAYDAMEYYAYGSNFLYEDCKENNTTKEHDGALYQKSCNENFMNYKSLEVYYNKIFTKRKTEELLKQFYLNVDEKLYFIPTTITENPYYLGYHSYKITSESKTKIEYLVKSKYFSKDLTTFDCGDDCTYEYKEYKFTILLEDGMWFVDEFTPPNI